MDEILDCAEVLGKKSPDSAYVYLKKLSSEVSNYSEKQRMRFYLVLADYQNKAYIDFVTDSLMLQVKNYYLRHGDTEEQMKALYLLGCTYRDLGESPLALQYYQEATDKCDVNNEHYNHRLLCVIYFQMSQIFHDQCLAEEELNAINKCKEIALSGNDTLMYISACELSMIPYDVKKEYDSVVVISERARRMYLEYGDTTKATDMLLPEVNALIELRDYRRAMNVIRIFENESSHFTKNTTPLPGREIYYYPKGLIHLHNNDLKASKECFDKLTTTPHKEAAYKGLMLTYQKLGIKDSIAKYALLFANANDLAYVRRNSEATERMAAAYRFSRSQNVAKRAVEQLLTVQKENEKIYTLLYVFVIFLLMSCFAYIRHKQNTSKRVGCLILELKYAKQRLKKNGRRIVCLNNSL